MCYSRLEKRKCTPKHYKIEIRYSKMRNRYRRHTLQRTKYCGKLSLRTVRQTLVASAKENRVNEE